MNRDVDGYCSMYAGTKSTKHREPRQIQSVNHFITLKFQSFYISHCVLVFMCILDALLFASHNSIYATSQAYSICVQRALHFLFTANKYTSNACNGKLYTYAMVWMDRCMNWCVLLTSIDDLFTNEFFFRRFLAGLNFPSHRTFSVQLLYKCWCRLQTDS